MAGHVKRAVASGIVLAAVVIAVCGCDRARSRTERGRGAAATVQGAFLENEFTKKLVGRWESAFLHKGKRNVESLELRKNGTVTVVFERSGTQADFQGSYKVIFDKPPTRDEKTFAKVAIITQAGTFHLFRVNFDRHSAVGTAEVFLRVDKEPFGVLRRK